MSAFGGKADIVKSHNAPMALLVFGCLSRAPSKECGRCLLTKFGLTQFTAKLFWRFAADRYLVFTIFDTLPPHAVAASDARPICTHHNPTPLNISKAAGERWKVRRLCRSAPNGPCRAVEPITPERSSLGPTPRSYTRASRLGTNWVKADVSAFTAKPPGRAG